MKKLLMLVGVALGVSSLFAYQFQFTDDKGYTWLLEEDSSDGPVAGSGEYVSQWWIVGVSPSPTGDFEIPAKLGGKAVYGIGINAFLNVNGLTNLTIAAGIRAISNGAFRDAADLTKVTIKGELDWVEADAFDGTKFLENAETEHQALVLGGHIYRYFSTNETYTVPAGVKVIDAYAFSTAPTNSEGKAFLKKITFNEGLEEIGVGAFDGAAVFEFDEIVLPDSVDWIGRAAFGRCTIKNLKLGAGMTNITDFKVWFESDFEDGDIEPSADTPRFGLGGDSFGTATELTGACGRAGGDVNDDSTLYWRWVAPFTGRVAFSTKDSTERNGSASDTELYVYDPSDFHFPIVFDDDYYPDCTSKVTFDVTQGSTYYFKFFYWGGSPSNAVMRWQAVKKPQGRAALESIDFGGATEIPDYLFYDDENPFTNLKSVTFGPGARKIGRMAFYGCTGLTNVTFGAGLRTIVDQAFYGCSALKSADFSAATMLESIGDQAFHGTGLVSVDLTGLSKLMQIGDSAFFDCSDLASVAFNEGLLQIGYSAFSGCPKLAKLVFPKTLLVIESYAFAHCTNLSEIVLNDGLKTIDDFAFYNESFDDEYNGVLKKVNIPSSVLSLGADVFGSCTNLAEITGCEGLLIVDAIAGAPFSFGEGVPASKQWYCGEFDPESGKKLDFRVVTLGKTVLGFQGECPAKLEAKDFGAAISIADYAFACCCDRGWGDPEEYNLSVSNLTSVTFPETLEMIGDGAFIGACNLTELKFAGDSSEVGFGSESFRQTGLKELAGTFRSLDAGAFEECPDLTDVNITTADFRARSFAGCTALTNVELVAYGVYPWIMDSEDSPFADCENLVSAKIDLGDGGIQGEGSCFFGNCMALRTVSFNARYIPEGLFNGKTDLESCQIGTNVTEIGGFAFQDSSKLTDLAIPDSVVHIGERAFVGCSGLTNLTGCAGVAFVDEQVFEDCTALFGDQTNGAFVVNGILASYCDVPGVTKAVIPEGVRVVASGSFVGCVVSEIEFPSTLEYIRDWTARGCWYLKTVVCKNPDILFEDNPEWNSEALFGDWVEVIVKKVGQRAYAFEWTYDKTYNSCYIAVFEELRFHNDETEDGPFTGGTSYVGWLMEKGSGQVVGSITVTSSALKDGQSKVTAKIEMAGWKKSYTAQFEVDEKTGKAFIADPESIVNGYGANPLNGMWLGGNWLSGQIAFDGRDYDVRGGNAKKDVDSFDDFANRVWAVAFYANSIGSTDLDLATVRGYSTMTFTVGKKGKIKVAGVLADGTKVSSTAQMVAGDNGVIAAPVSVGLYAGKKGGFSCLLKFFTDVNSTPVMTLEADDGYDAKYVDGTLSTWTLPCTYANKRVWKSVGLSVESVGEVVAAIGLTGNKFGLEIYDNEWTANGNNCENEMLRRVCKGFEPYFSGVEGAIDPKSGKLQVAKADKWSILAEKQKTTYAADIEGFLAREDGVSRGWWYLASDGKYLMPYEGSYDGDRYIPTDWFLIDEGIKIDKTTGEAIYPDFYNECNTKVSYNKKTGQFTGSSAYYWVDETKPEKHALKTGKFTLGGVYIDGSFYGTAVAKGIESFCVDGGTWTNDED